MNHETLSPQALKARRNRRIKAGIAGLALLATAGMTVAGTQATWVDDAHDSTPVSTGTHDLTTQGGQKSYTFEHGEFQDMVPDEVRTEGITLESYSSTVRGVVTYELTGAAVDASSANFDYRFIECDGDPDAPPVVIGNANWRPFVNETVDRTRLGELVIGPSDMRCLTLQVRAHSDAPEGVYLDDADFRFISTALPRA